MKLPEDLVVVGYVSGAYGINGWIRIHPYSSDADALLSAKTWWLDKPEMHDVDMLSAKTHGGDVVAQLMGISGRDAAEALKGTAVSIRRSHFPALSDNEFYWVDLIGLDVENLRGERLGVVGDLMDYGAHPILKVTWSNDALAAAEGQVAPARAAPTECLIPFVEQFVKTVDQAGRKITVDWERDY
ncbi:MAG: ribosome maturation factor RimM [Janthinobacterium lividum]